MASIASNIFGALGESVGGMLAAARPGRGVGGQHLARSAASSALAPHQSADNLMAGAYVRK